MTKIFTACKNLLLWAIMCVFLSLCWFTTYFLQWTANPLRFQIASYHTMTVTLMYSEIQLQRGQQSILVFQWRLTSENVNTLIVKESLEHPGYSSRGTREMCRTNHDQRCWAASRLRFNVLYYFSKSFWDILDILSYVFAHVDVWYFNHKRRFTLVIWEWLEFNQGVLLMHVTICTDIG